jgi:hypothetical protein
MPSQFALENKPLVDFLSFLDLLTASLPSYAHGIDFDADRSKSPPLSAELTSSQMRNRPVQSAREVLLPIFQG